MVRRIITIDKEKCDGCGVCVTACHEDAIMIKDGVATLIRDDYCDGLGDCLPNCHAQAITFVTREATEYDDDAVKKNQILKKQCPSTYEKLLNTKITDDIEDFKTSKLSTWPVQINLAPVMSDMFHNSNLLISADCCAYAYFDFHNKFLQNRVALIGCPKLDQTDYSTKLSEIIKNNNIKTITVARMEVPCCYGIENYTKIALENSGKVIPIEIVTISLDGNIL